jgi:hypothetical protein
MASNGRGQELRLVKDGEHLADLVSYGYSQPHSLYRVLPVIADETRIDDAIALRWDLPNPGSVLVDKASGTVYPDECFVYRNVEHSYEARIRFTSGSISRLLEPLLQWWRIRRDPCPAASLNQTDYQLCYRGERIADLTRPLYHCGQFLCGVKAGAADWACICAVLKPDSDAPQPETTLVDVRTGKVHDAQDFRVEFRHYHNAAIRWVSLP